MTGHDELRHLLGGYVLGGLSPEDRARLEQHLTTCDECRDELARYAPLPGLLRQASLSGPVVPGPRGADVDASAVSPEVLPRLLAEVRRRRAVRRRSAILAAAAVAVLALAVPWLFRDGDPASEPGPSSTVVSLAAVGDAASEGEAELIEKGWGTALTLTASQLPDQGPFTLQVVADDGTEQLAATWGPTPAGKALVSGATSIPRAQIVSVRVVGPDGPLLDARMPR